MAPKDIAGPGEPGATGSVSSFVGLLVGLPTAVAMIVALFLDLPGAGTSTRRRSQMTESPR